MHSTKQNLTVTERTKLAQLRKHALRVGDAASTPAPPPSHLPAEWRHGQVILVGLAAILLVFIAYALKDTVMNFLDPFR